MENTKTREITVESSKPHTLDEGKVVYNIEDVDGVRFSTWEKTLYDLLGKGISANVRFYEKQQGKFKNRTIIAVARKLGDGTFAPWVESQRRGGFKGRSYQDQEAINTAVCIKAAVHVAGALLMKQKDIPTMDFSWSLVTTLVQRFKNEYFAKKAEALSANGSANEEPEGEAVAEEEVPA